MILLFAPDGIGEVDPDTDLAAVIVAAVAAHPEGPLRDGDVVVVTSKVISKVEGRGVQADDREAAITAETVRTVARRGPTRIVTTRTGLTLAAAGVDNSNVTPGTVLLLPADPDRSAAHLRTALEQLTGLRLAVIVSDTAGRAWRIGQTDQAIGAAGVLVAQSYAGRVDPYGNPLQVTQTAVADEVAAAADLVKAKTTGRPVAVVRGLRDLTSERDDGARDLVRPTAEDLFSHGTREAVLAAVLTAYGVETAYERIVALDEPERTDAVLTTTGATGPAAELVRALLVVDLAKTAAHGLPG